MTDAVTTTALVSFLLAGLAGSLHCIGMCGPILAGFSMALRGEPVTLTVDPAIARQTRPRFAIAWNMLAYHAGRISTYAALGFAAGVAGNYLRHGSQWLGLQQRGAAMLSAAVILSGVLLIARKKAHTGCGGSHGQSHSKPRRWFAALKANHGSAPKLLLGAAMGFLPCGLVYTMLVLAAALPTPVESAAGMLLFGLGTVPSLTAVLLTANLIPARLRDHGPRIAAVVVIVTGSWMLTRSLTVTAESCCDTHHGMSAETQAPERTAIAGK